MKFKIQQEDLQKALDIVSGVVPSKTTLPILTCILVEADQDGLQLSATNLDVSVTIRDDKVNGVLFEGTKGRILVNRGRLTGKPVEDLATNPLPEGAMENRRCEISRASHTTSRPEPLAIQNSHVQ